MVKHYITGKYHAAIKIGNAFYGYYTGELLQPCIYKYLGLKKPNNTLRWLENFKKRNMKAYLTKDLEDCSKEELIDYIKELLKEVQTLREIL